VRIVGGKNKGCRLQIPKAFDSRPTTDFAKEALFSIIENEFDISTCDVLDLFTGTGSLALEFASRDAQKVIAVDINTACLSFIVDATKKFQMTQIRVLKNDALRFLKIANITFDIIIADPPYEYKHYPAIIESVFEKNLLKPNGMLIVEHGKQNDFSMLPNFLFLRNYGGVHFSFFRELEDSNS
jgi:16S rRNA (guanine966-N2)-methyltransferase